ncbi:MAG: rod shape-determining protein, partial [Clostridia bacterium]|nr:rod shape-determining protein [Clostridia bacterium]
CLMTGLPRIVSISSTDIIEALGEVMQQIVDAIHRVLENTPPELAADIYDNGIMLAGGGALLGGLDALISYVTGVKVTIAKNPLDCVAIGIGHVLESIGDISESVLFRNRGAR